MVCVAARPVARCAGCSSLFIGLALGFVGIDGLSGEARLTFGVPYLLDGIDVGHRRRRTVRGRRGADARWPRQHVGDVSPAVERSRLDDARGLVAIVEAVAARHGDRLPARRAAGRRRRAADAALLRGREASVDAAGGVRPRRDRRRGRPRSRQQRLGGRHAGAAAHARPADVGDRGGAARRVPAVRPAAGPAAVRARAAARVGRDREPLRRQRDAARAQPAARAPLGEAAARFPGRSSTPAFSSSPRSAPTACIARPAISCC